MSVGTPGGKPPTPDTLPSFLLSLQGRVKAIEDLISGRTLMAQGNAAGGDLAGTFPNPTVGHVLNGKTPVTTDTTAYVPSNTTAYTKNSTPANWFLGDFALEYAVSNVGYGPGLGNPFASMGFVVGLDTGGRLSSANYITRNSGTYMAGFAVSFSASGGDDVFGGVYNASSGFKIGVDGFVPSGLLAGACTYTTLIPCSAGQTLTPFLQVSAATTLLAADPQTGNVASMWWAGQVS